MRLIDADALKEKLENGYANTHHSRIYAIAMLKKAPTIEAEPVRHGEWKEIEGFDGDTLWQCSVCGIEWCFIEGTPYDNGTNYCPNCGAKMDGKEKME